MDLNAHLSHASYMQGLNIQTIYPYAAERGPTLNLSSREPYFNSATAVLGLLVHEPHLQTG